MKALEHGCFAPIMLKTGFPDPGKRPLFERRRKNFCYAGSWALLPTTPMA
jgi:hypothetical protein